MDRKEYLLRVWGGIVFFPLKREMHGNKELPSLFLDLVILTCGVWNCYSNLATTMRESWLNTPRMAGQKHGKVLGS